MSVFSKGGCPNSTQSQQISTSKSPGRGIKRKHSDPACGVKVSKPNAIIVVKSTRNETRSTPAPTGLVPSAMGKPLSDQPTTHIEESRKRKRITPIQSTKTKRGKKNKQVLRKHIHDQFIVRPDYILHESDKIVKSSNDIADHYLDIAVKNTACHTQATTTYANLHEENIQNILDTWNSRVQMKIYNDSTLIYKCFMCNLFWWHLQEFREHLLSHPQMNIIFGSVEGQQSLIAYQVQSPKREILEECPKCGNAFKLKKFEAYLHCHHCIKRHRTIEGKKNGRNKYLQCKICARYIDSEDIFKKHMRVFHDVRSDLPIVNNFKTCIRCDEKYSAAKYHYCFTRGLDAHCTFCFRNFVNIDLRREHERNNRGFITCEICKLRLPSKCMIFQHMLRHSGKYTRVLKCRLCFGLKVFADTEGATIHLMVQHLYYLIQMKRYISDIIIPKSCIKREYRSNIFDMTGRTKAVTKEEEITKSKNFDYLLSDVDGHKQTEVYIVDENLWYLIDDILNMDPETANVDYNQLPEVNEHMETETEFREQEFDGEYDNQMIIDENREKGIDLNETSNYNENDSPIHNDISEDEPEHYADDIIILDFGDESVEMTPVEEPSVKISEVLETEIKSPKHSISEEENIKKDLEETNEKAVEKIVDQNKVTAINTDVAKVCEAAPIKIEKEEKYLYKDSDGDFKVADAFIQDRTCNERDHTYARCYSSQPVYKFTKHWVSRIVIVKIHKTEDIINNDCKDVDMTAIEGTPMDIPELMSPQPTYPIDTDTIAYSRKVLTEDISRALLERENMPEDTDEFFLGRLIENTDFRDQLDNKSLKFEFPKNIDSNTHLDNHSVVDDKAKLNGHESNYAISTTDVLINDEAKTSLESEILTHLEVQEADGGHLPAADDGRAAGGSRVLAAACCFAPALTPDTPGASFDIVQKYIITGHKPDENIQPEDIEIDEVSQTVDFPNDIEVKQDPYLFSIADEAIPSNVDLENIEQAYSEYNPLVSWDNTDELENSEKYFIHDTSNAGDPMLSKIEYDLPRKPQETNNLEAFQNIINKIDSSDVLTFRKPLDTNDTEDAINLGDDKCFSSTSLGSESYHMTDTLLQIEDMSPIETHVSADLIQRKEPENKVRKRPATFIKSPKRAHKG